MRALSFWALSAFSPSIATFTPAAGSLRTAHECWRQDFTSVTVRTTRGRRKIGRVPLKSIFSCCVFDSMTGPMEANNGAGWCLIRDPPEMVGVVNLLFQGLVPSRRCGNWRDVKGAARYPARVALGQLAKRKPVADRHEDGERRRQDRDDQVIWGVELQQVLLQPMEALGLTRATGEEGG